MSKHYFCVFCATKQSKKDLKYHIWKHHLKSGFDQNLNKLIDNLVDYCSRLKESINNGSQRQCLPTNNVKQLVVGCVLCDQIIDYYKLNGFDRNLKPKKSVCICGRTDDLTDSSFVKCIQCNHSLHLNCFSDSSDSGQDSTQYLCEFCKTRDFSIESSDDLKPMDLLKHFRQHLNYSPFKCKIVSCKLSFDMFSLLVNHIQIDHQMSEEMMKNSEQSVYSFDKIVEIEEVFEEKGIKCELMSFDLNNDCNQSIALNCRIKSESIEECIPNTSNNSNIRSARPVPLSAAVTTSVNSSTDRPIANSLTTVSNTTEQSVNSGLTETECRTPTASTSSTSTVANPVLPITFSVQLPKDLTPELNRIINKIKKLSYVSEWLSNEQTYNFFRQRLIELEKKCSEIPESGKNQIYLYLSSYLPFSESELKAKANNEVQEAIDLQIEKELNCIKGVVNYWKPDVISHYNQQNQTNGTLNEFPWNQLLTRHLRRIIDCKHNCFNRLSFASNSNTNGKQNNFGLYLNRFVDKEIKPILPIGSNWMSLSLLTTDINKQLSKSIHKPIVNSVVAQSGPQSTPEKTPFVANNNRSVNVSNEEVIDISDDSSNEEEEEDIINESVGQTSAETFANKSQTSISGKTSKSGQFKRLCVRLGHISCVYCLAFDRTGKYVFTGSDDYLIKIWSVENGCRLVSCLRGHQHEITDLSVNYENTLLASGDINYLIIIWRLKDTKCLKLLKCHTKQITSLKFCSLSQSINRYLVSTGDDGRVCFWRYNSNSLEFQSEPNPQVREQHSKRSGISCSSFSAGGHLLAVGSTDSFITIYKVDAEERPIKIFEQKKHWGHVDRIHFSNNGLHFISSSNNVWNEKDVDKDNAFIWNFNNNSWKEIPIKVYVQKSGEFSYKKLIVELCWTCDDKQVITSLNDFSIKIWDSTSGQLVQILDSHTDEVHCIQSHPKFPHIFLSAAYDTKVILWNLKKGKAIKIFNSLKGRAILDASFSPNGLMFATTDCYGRLSIFGIDSNQSYKSLPEHMFFHTDYHPIVEKSNQLVDSETKVEPHLLSVPFLVDINGSRYPPKVQRLVPGREDCFDHQNEPYVCIVHENRFVLDPVVKPEPLLYKSKNTSSDVIKVKDLIEILGNQMSRSQMFDILFVNSIKLLTRKSKTDFKKFFEALVRVVTTKITVEAFYDQLKQLYTCPPPQIYIPILKYCLPFFKPKSINEIFSESISSQTKLRILEGLDINSMSEESVPPNNPNDSIISLSSYTPRTWNSFISISQSLIHSTEPTKDNVLECLKYLSVQLMLASVQPFEVNIKINSLFQSLINNTIEVDDFIAKSKEQMELQFAKEDYSQFLKQTLPQLRYLMHKEVISIDSITSPPLLPNKVHFRAKRQSDHNYSDLRYEESADKRTLFLRDKSVDTGPASEKFWKVAKKQLLRRPGNWMSYNFDKTLDSLWSERDAVIQLSCEELNEVYEQLKQKESKELDFLNLKSLLNTCGEILMNCDSDDSRSKTPNNALIAPNCSVSSATIVSSEGLSRSTPSQSTRSKLRPNIDRSANGRFLKRKRLEFSAEETQTTSRTKSRRMSKNRGDNDLPIGDKESEDNLDIEAIEVDDNNRQCENPMEEFVDQTIDSNNTNENSSEVEGQTEGVVPINEISTEEPNDLNSIRVLANLEQNANRVIGIIDEMVTKNPIVKEVETQTTTTLNNNRCDSETQTEYQIEIKREIKSEFEIPFQVKQELEPQMSHYLCVFCRQSTQFEDRKQAFDHYRKHLALVIRCELCFVNFSNIKSFTAHNSEHSKSDKNTVNVRNYCLSLDWIHSFLDFQKSQTFGNLFQNTTEFCPVCRAFKLNNKHIVSAQSSDKSLDNKHLFVEHLRKHLNFDTVLECIQCKRFENNIQKVKFYFGLTDAQNHLNHSHDLKLNSGIDYSNYFNTIDCLSPNLEEFIRKCLLVFKVINDLYETNSIE